MSPLADWSASALGALSGAANRVTSVLVSLSRLIALTAVFVASGCQLLGGARIHELATGSAKPSNVACLVSVTEKDKPVPGLPPSAFQVSENDQLLDPETAQLQLIEPSRYAAFHTVLLVDTSVSNDATARKALAKAAAAFVRRVRMNQAVTVVAFDGSEDVRVIADYPAEAHTSSPDIVDALSSLSPKDPSRNLRGAVVRGFEILDERLASSPHEAKLGTVAVFARGPDLAGRTPEGTLKEALGSHSDNLVYIGVTGEPVDDTAKQLSESGQIMAQSADTLPIAFEDAGALVDGLLDQYYLVSYCSPSRAGKRTAKITVSVPVPDGKNETDSLSAEFDATGFTAGCDSQKVPTLVAKHPRAKSNPKPESASVPANRKPLKSRATAPEKAPAAADSADEEAPVPAKPGYAQ